MVSSCELEQPSSFPCSWHCSSKNHSTSAAAPGCALSSEAAQTRWQQQNTQTKPDGSGQAPTLRESLEFKANGCRVSSGRTASRCKPNTSTDFGGYSSKKGHLEKQQGRSILAIWVENSRNCLKHFCDMQQPDPAVMPQLFPPQHKSFKNSIMVTVMRLKNLPKAVIGFVSGLLKLQLIWEITGLQ